MIQIGPIGAIAFDLDGTLVDSAPDIAAALDSALEEEGLRRFDATTVQRWIGDGPDVLIGRALDTQGLVDAPAELRTRLRRRFDAYTLGAPLERGTVFSGVVDLLEQLHARLPMIVITNKPSALARVVVEAAGLARFFVAVFGADQPERRKPAPAMLQAASAALGVPLAQLLMVGDSPLDLLAAERAGCPAAWVAWGYGGEQANAGAAAWRITEPHHLLHALKDGRRLPAAID